MKTKTFLLMYLGSFIAMFFTMYAMIAEWTHFYFNINKAYMALLMVAAMGIVNGLVMTKMFTNKKIQLSVLGVSILATILFTWIIRTQGLVGDKSFLQSMIPHHSSAILMCNQADISDSEIQQLCDEIVKTQKEEIAIMQRILNEKY